MKGITKSFSKYIGFDVSKDWIDVAIADEGREKARHYGKIPNRPESVRKLMRRLGDPQELSTCYEAGPTGYGLCRQLRGMAIECEVVAPSLIPQRAGNRVKTDRRDAIRLAQLWRAGELTPVWTPDESDEALRDLTRAREDAKVDLRRARQRLLKFLLRHGRYAPEGTKNWSAKHRQWLDTQQFELPALRIVFGEYLHAIDEQTARLKRLEAEIAEQASQSAHAEVIRALQSLRGVADVVATTLAAEIGRFNRFGKPGPLTAWAGLVPSEDSSGETRRQGGITKTGNSHARRVLVEAAWSYRYPPALKGAIRKRQEGLPPEVRAIAWKAQDRLHRKYRRLIGKGKRPTVAATAVARELLCFAWEIACWVERRQEASRTAA